MEGLAKYLTERQEIKVRYGYKVNGEIEWIDGGVYYLSRWESKENSNRAKFEASLLFDTLSMVYDQGIYYAEGRSLYDLAIDVLTFANLRLSDEGEVRWVIDESLKNITTTAVLPLDTVANCLQFIANAGCCILYQDRKGIIRIEKREYVPDDYSINPANSFSKPETTLSKPIKNITVSVYSQEVGEKRTIGRTGKFNRNLKPVWDFYIEHSAAGQKCLATNFTIHDTYDHVSTTYESISYAGHTELRVIIEKQAQYVSDESFSISGQPIETSSTTLTLPVGDTGETIEIDNPLITSEEHALTVAEWVKSTISKRQTVSLSWRADPRLDVGDVIENVSTYNTNDVVMTKVNYNYNGAFKGTGEGRVM
jgi:hypothetical protein